jgi:hypothetical protein
MIKRPRFILVPQRQVNAASQGANLLIGWHQRCAAADGCTHGFAKGGVKHCGTVFHRARWADEGRFAVAERWHTQHFQELQS